MCFCVKMIKVDATNCNMYILYRMNDKHLVAVTLEVPVSLFFYLLDRKNDKFINES